MDHGRWNVHGGFTGDEKDATPSGRFHDGKIMAAKAHATHEVRFDNGAPIVIGEGLERLRVVDAEIVDEDVDGGKSFDDALGGGRVGQVGGERLDRAADGASGLLDAGGRAAVDDYMCALSREGLWRSRSRFRRSNQ